MRVEIKVVAKVVEEISVPGDGHWQTPPNLISPVQVDCWGAGGGQYTALFSGGGGGGAFAQSAIVHTPGEIVPFVIGHGAVHGDGEDTTWGESVIAKGGGGANDMTGGSGGRATESIGQLIHSGGRGGEADAGITVHTGGGGGSGGPQTAGGDAAGDIGAAAVADGGGGGSGAIHAAQPSGADTHGQQPGGGGAGDFGLAASAGAHGMIRLTYFVGISCE